MLKKLEMNDGLLINTDEILTVSCHDAPKPPLTAGGLVIDEDKYVYLQECLIGHNMMSEEYRNESWIKTVNELNKNIEEYRDWRKCMKNAAHDGKELHITNAEPINTDDNSIQLKITFELKDIGDE